MPAEKHTFDPEGDLLLQLSQPAKKKVKIQRERQERLDSIDLDDPQTLSDPVASPSADAEDNDGEPEDLISHDFIAICKEGRQQRAGGSSTIPANGVPDQDQDEDEESLPDVVGINMLVSSRHMALACTVFKAMLRHEGFKEGHTLSAEGSVQVPLPDDDPRAMQILLDAIQGRNKRVPRKVSLRTLASIAVLADKYQMVEALESFSDV